MKLCVIVAVVLLACASARAYAAPLEIEFAPSMANPQTPQMGDRLTFKSTIRNDGTVPIEGVIAWLSLVQTDKGKEQPVDLEDWSAHKAVTVPTLAPGEGIQTDWPMRLIQAGNYRVVISAVTRDSAGLTVSPFADFAVREKPVVESTRVLPVAFGLPTLLALLLVWSWRRARD
jgi:hypothetical protein